MKVYSRQNVFEAALDRIRFLFDEFPHVIPSVSGGKDSTVIFELAMRVAEERGRLPLPVLFIDQEAEWLSVIEQVRYWMTDPRVKPLWLQCPIRLFNATSASDPWLYCWQPGAEWIREREPYALTENIYGTDRFKELFGEFLNVEYAGERACIIGGVRTEESPARELGLVNAPKYKWVTWGKRVNKKAPPSEEHYTFYPIYDWSFSDVWHAIHVNQWRYCKLYDYQYQYGLPQTMMRVSNVHHETALWSLFWLQEIEPGNWNRLIKRLGGVNTAAKFGKHEFFVRQLPRAFRDWREYRDYLLEHLIDNPQFQQAFRTRFRQMDRQFLRGGFDFTDPDVMYKEQVTAVLVNDFEMTKLNNFNVTHNVAKWKRERMNELGTNDPTSI